MSGGPEPLDVARTLADWAVEAISAHRPNGAEVSTKENPADYVTVVDRAVELHVRDALGAAFPADRIVGEELGDTGAGQRTWFVDPVDGTTNYVHGVPWSSFSLALADADGPLVGVVADPYRAEVFSAARGQGAWVNGVPVRCADVSTLEGGLLLTEWAAYRPWDGMLPMLAALSRLGCTTRIMGSSALTLATAAAGRASAAVLGGFNTWDVLAGVLIAREAGARVLGRDGGEAPAVPGADDGGVLVAAPGVAGAAWQAWQAEEIDERTPHG